MSRILIIGEDEEVLGLLRYILGKEGFQVRVLKPATTLRGIKTLLPDLVIIDSMALGLRRPDISEEIRRDKLLARLPVLVFMRPKANAGALRSGARVNGYLKRPIDAGKLLERVHWLTRSRADLSEPEHPIIAGALTIDAAACSVERAGKRVPLSFLQFRLLHYLASRPNEVCRRDQLLNDVWRDSHTTSRSIDKCIRHLREMIEDDPNEPTYIKSVRGVGYAFEMTVRLKKTGT